MPELPEVQTFVNNLLNKNIINKKIIKVVFIKPKVLKNYSIDTFGKNILNKKIVKISRIGKYLIFWINDLSIFAIHLRMEGKVIIEDQNSFKFNKNHIMFYFQFEDGRILNYYDSRMFGTLDYFSDYDSFINSKQISKLGLEPFDYKLNSCYLFNIAKSKKTKIKTFLLDQTIITGIGNIYADEILFASKINPLTPCNEITINQWNKIIKFTKNILEESIKNNGTTISSYSFDHNKQGSFQDLLKVHTKSNSNCCVCKTKIIKIKVNGRGTYLCPKCQKKT